jgi:uncharacterized protein YbjT (DUF2867 family)
LLEEGWRLRCLNHNPDHAHYLPQSPAVEIVRGDISRPESWQEALQGAAAMIHMAHVGFAQHVVQGCAAAGVRRVIALSSTRRFTQFPEESARRVIAGEAALESSPLDYSILRSAMIFGGDRDNNLEKLARWLRRWRWLPLLAGGRNLVQPIYTWDLVNAIVCALQHPQTTIRRALTLAGPQPMTQREMVEKLAQAMGRPLAWIPVPYALMFGGAWTLEKLMRRPPINRDQIRRTLEDKVFDLSEAQQCLPGWQPRPFEEAIELKLAGKA